MRVARYGDEASDALERIDPHGPDIWAQVDFARDEESALTVDDVLSRRTTLAVRGLASGQVSEAVRHRLGARSLADTPSSERTTLG